MPASSPPAPHSRAREGRFPNLFGLLESRLRTQGGNHQLTGPCRRHIILVRDLNISRARSAKPKCGPCPLRCQLPLPGSPWRPASDFPSCLLGRRKLAFDMPREPDGPSDSATLDHARARFLRFDPAERFIRRSLANCGGIANSIAFTPSHVRCARPPPARCARSIQPGERLSTAGRRSSSTAISRFSSRSSLGRKRLSGTRHISNAGSAMPIPLAGRESAAESEARPAAPAWLPLRTGPPLNRLRPGTCERRQISLCRAACPPFRGADRKLGPVASSRLPEKRVEICFHSSLGKAEPIGYLAIAKTRSDELHDIELAL